MSNSVSNLSVSPTGGNPPEREQNETHVQAPTVITASGIAEEIWDRKGGPAFALKRFDGDTVEIVDDIETERKIVYLPVDNDHLKKGMVLVPDGPVECTFDEVYAEACDLAFQIYDCEESRKDEFRLLVALAIGSWFLDRFNPNGTVVAGIGKFAPIISIRGRSGSGKNRALNALRLVSYRPFFDLATVRTPSLYRPLDLWGGTLCLDECDVEGSEQSDFIHLINSRAYGTPISRQNPESVALADVFASFGLTMVTQRRSWRDDATENRTLAHYATKSQKALPTAELDSWVQRGLALQNKLLYLRLRYWDQVVIDKAARIEGVSDHRLTAAVLPLLALKDFAPSMVANLKQILREFEEKRKEVRAGSSDGLVVNALWEKVDEGLVGDCNRFLYFGKDKIREKGIGEEAIEWVTPLSMSELAELLNWKSAGSLRRVVHGLQLTDDVEKAPDKIRLGRRTYRPIWFDVSKLEPLLQDFVVDYRPNALAKRLLELGLVPVVSDVPLPARGGGSESGGVAHIGSATSGTSGTNHTPVSPSGESDPPTDAGTVTSVTNPETGTSEATAA